jgi:hypothetical protein
MQEEIAHGQGNANQVIGGLLGVPVFAEMSLQYQVMEHHRRVEKVQAMPDDFILRLQEEFCCLLKVPQ